MHSYYPGLPFSAAPLYPHTKTPSHDPILKSYSMHNIDPDQTRPDHNTIQHSNQNINSQLPALPMLSTTRNNFRLPVQKPAMHQNPQSATLLLGKVPAEPETDDENPPLVISLRLHTIARRRISARGGGREVSKPLRPPAVDVGGWRYYFTEGYISLVFLFLMFLLRSIREREKGREDGEMGRWGDGEMGRRGDIRTAL